MPDNLVNCLGLIVSIKVLFYMCRINYDGRKTCSRSCAGVKTMITLGVQEFDGSSNSHRRFYGNKSEKSMSLPKKLIGTRQVDRRKSRSLLKVHRRITEGSSDDRRKFAENLPEEAIDAPEQVAVNVLGNIVVSTMIKLEMGGDPINLILGQLGP